VGAGLTGDQTIESVSGTPLERRGVAGRGNDDQKTDNQQAVRTQERRDKSPRSRDHREPPPKKTTKSGGVLGFKVRAQYAGGA
jgi:hypothetical protein